MEQKKTVYDILEQHKDKLSQYDKIKRHLGTKISHEFTNADGTKDTFEFTPMTYEIYIKFMSMAKGMKGEEIEITDTMMKDSLDLMTEVVKQSYPDWPLEICQQFVAANFQEMMQVLTKITPKSEVDVHKIKKIKNQLNFVQQEANKNVAAEQVKG